MDGQVIAKPPRPGAQTANLVDYDGARREFSWDRARAGLAGLPRAGGINIAHEAVDRHVLEGRGARVALRWLASEGQPVDFSYAELSALSNRFANALAGLGVQRGERVFTLLGRVPALYVAPDLAGEPLHPERRYREQFEFDSMDFLRYVAELHRLTGMDLPERDYPRLHGLASAVAYLRERSLPP